MTGAHEYILRSGDHVDPRLGIIALGLRKPDLGRGEDAMPAIQPPRLGGRVVTHGVEIAEDRPGFLDRDRGGRGRDATPAARLERLALDDAAEVPALLEPALDDLRR
jgi:hypothetical protein